MCPKELILYIDREDTRREKEGVQHTSKANDMMMSAHVLLIPAGLAVLEFPGVPAYRKEHMTRQCMFSCAFKQFIFCLFLVTA